MKKYGNQNGNSGIAAYEIGGDFIRVRFFGSTEIYTYSCQTAGKRHIAIMKALALHGLGLSTYIAQHVHDKFDK